MTRLSVIIPGYNTPEVWWLRCLDSVRRACGPNDEIICVDDGTPGGIPILSDMMKKDRRLQVVVQSNSGLSAARNAGMAVAKGEFITFVDSDDEVCPAIFNECLNSLSRTCADIALYGVKVIWVAEKLSKLDLPPNTIKGLLTPDNVKVLFDKCLLNYACNKIYRRSFLSNNKLMFHPYGMPCEDIIFNLECIMAQAKWVMVDKVGYIYYRTGGTLLSKYKETQSEGNRVASEIWIKYKDSIPSARDVLGAIGEIGEIDELQSQWRNIWMPGTSYSLVERWRWLKAHPKIGGSFEFIRMFIFMILRRWLYVRPIRRWHIKRLYPKAYDI
jgi:glycosyltransferase involved in cell wall biosynthesis